MNTIIVERHDNVGLVRLNRPQGLNAITQEMDDLLLDAWNTINADPDIWCAILSAEGEEIETRDDDGAVIVTARGWRAMRGLALADPLKAFDAWNELWLGAAAAHDRFLRVQTMRSLGELGWSMAWRIAPR